jgi:hypothetical protein
MNMFRFALFFASGSWFLIRLIQALFSPLALGRVCSLGLPRIIPLRRRRVALEVFQFHSRIFLRAVIRGASAHYAEPFLGVRIPLDLFVFHCSVSN